MGRPVPNPPRPNRTKALTRTSQSYPRLSSAFAFLSVISSGNLLLPLPLPFFLSFPLGICFFLCPRLSFCHSLWESASSFALAFLSVIPSGNLLLPLPLPFFLSFPLGICFCTRGRPSSSQPQRDLSIAPTPLPQPARTGPTAPPYHSLGRSPRLGVHR